MRGAFSPPPPMNSSPKPACVPTRRSRSSAGRDFRPPKRNSPTVAATDIAAVASTDPEYPALLREIPDYPHVLYIKGCVEALSARCLSHGRDTRGDALTDRRRATGWWKGSQSAGTGALQSSAGWRSASTLRRTARRLRQEVPTVAVLANPLPGGDARPAYGRGPRHPRSRRVRWSRNCIRRPETERHTSIWPATASSPGLSAGCIVVESPDSGGSLFTAHCADSYDRTVMAVPGRATDRASAGTNHLIRNRKAQLVLTADDVIRELMWDLGAESRNAARQNPPTPELTPDEAGLLGCFRTDDPLSVEALGELTRAESRRAGDAARGSGAGRSRAPAAREPIHESYETDRYAFTPLRPRSVRRATAKRLWRAPRPKPGRASCCSRPSTPKATNGCSGFAAATRSGASR